MNCKGIHRGVLIVSNKDDDHTDTITQILKELNQPFFRFNTETFPFKTSLNLSLSGGLLRSLENQEGIDLSMIKSVWYRRPVPPIMYENKFSSGYIKFIQNESNAALWSLYTTLNAFWVNPPLLSSRLLERNKLYQLKKAMSVGLKVPDTIITNNPRDLYNFCKKKGGVIAVKLLKGDWFLKEDTQVPLFIYTQKINLSQISDHMHEISLSPIFAQEYIDKKIELRITIVGKKIFACAIHSQESEQTKIDWRNYDLEKVKHEAYNLPEEISNKLLIYVNDLNLQYGAIDMILTPQNEYVFLEINPSGQWKWIEDLTGMPISETLATILANPPEL